jgi:hypothetical protein
MFAVAAITISDKYTFFPLSCTILTGQPWCGTKISKRGKFKLDQGLG